MQWFIWVNDNITMQDKRCVDGKKEKQISTRFVRDFFLRISLVYSHVRHIYSPFVKMIEEKNIFQTRASLNPVNHSCSNQIKSER